MYLGGVMMCAVQQRDTLLYYAALWDWRGVLTIFPI